jgi:WD40 repeat protein
MKTKKETELLLLIGGVIPVIIILFSIFQIRSNNIIKSANEPVNLWSCSFLSDGKTLATAGGLSNPNDTPHRGELVLWDLAKSSERFVLKEKSSVRSVTCSPDGQFIAIGEFNGATKLIDPDTGTIIKTLTVQDAVNAVVFSPDTKLVANASLNDKITLWNIETGGGKNIGVAWGNRYQCCRFCHQSCASGYDPERESLYF